MLELCVTPSTCDLDPTIGVKLLDQVLAGNRWHTTRYTPSVYPATAITPVVQADANIAFAQSPPGIGRKRPSLPGQPPGDRASAVPLRLPQMRPVGWKKKKKKAVVKLAELKGWLHDNEV
jgi:hypothetical protein